MTLTATPAAGWGFKEWTGGITTTDNPATVTMDGDQSVPAVFYRTTLTVTSDGEGQANHQSLRRHAAPPRSRSCTPRARRLAGHRLTPP